MKVTITADAVASAEAEPDPEQDDACPEDPDGLHFVGCGCDHASPDDHEAMPEPEGEADSTAVAAA